MKNLFREYYYPGQKDIDEIWDKSLIVFDTCSLLNLYLYTKSARRQYFDVMKHYKNRLWLPYQVGLEFNRNRISKISEAESLYGELSSIIEAQIEKFTQSITNIFKVKDSYREDILKIISQDKDKILAKLQERKADHIDFDYSLEKDNVLDSILTLFDGKVGEDFDKDKLSKLFTEGKGRFENCVPPGYCDVDKKSDKNKKDNERRIYGDLIVWKQIMVKSKEEKKDIIFITDDRKEDWWLTFKGKTLSPRVELYKEFFEQTQQRVLIYRPDVFLRFATSKTAVNVDKKTIHEVETTRYTLNPLVKKIMSEFTDDLKQSDDKNAALASLTQYEERLKEAMELRDLARNARGYKEYIDDIETGSYVYIRDEKGEKFPAKIILKSSRIYLRTNDDALISMSREEFADRLVTFD